MIPLLLALAITPIEAPKVDAFFNEWADAPVLSMSAIRGTCGGRDLSATPQIAYDAKRLYFAVQVIDDRTLGGGRATGDGLSLRFVLPNGRTRKLQVVLNDLEPPHGARLLLDGKPYRRGQIRATTRVDGWALELSMSLRDLPGWIGGPRQFAAVITDTDADPTQVEGVCSTNTLDAKGMPALPSLNFGGAEPFFEAFRAERPDGHELRRLTTDLDHDGTRELVVLTTADLFVASYALPGGSGYVYFTHGWGIDPKLVRLEPVKLGPPFGTGLLIERQEWAVPDETQITIAELYTLRADGLRRVFAQQTGETAPEWKLSAKSSLSIRPGKAGPTIHVKPARVRGFNPGNIVSHGGSAPAFQPIPWPWAHPRGTRWRLGETGVTQLKSGKP